MEETKAMDRTGSRAADAILILRSGQGKRGDERGDEIKLKTKEMILCILLDGNTRSKRTQQSVGSGMEGHQFEPRK